MASQKIPSSLALVSPDRLMRVTKTSPDSPDHDSRAWSRAIHAIAAGIGDVTLQFQPIVDLRRGVVAGYEALARFAGPPYASPDQWFHQAAVTGQSIELEAHVIGLALRRREMLPPNTFVSINVSPSVLASPRWGEILAPYRHLDHVVVEVTEHEAIANYGAAVLALKLARARGALLAVDDAGAGYASLQHILRLRPDLVKLDRTFISRCHEDPARSSLIETVGLMADRLDARIVAEGVETDAELRRLIELGVPLAQGWFLGYPSGQFSPVPWPAARVIRAAPRPMSDHAVAGQLIEPWPALASSALESARAATTPTVVLDADQRPVGWLGTDVRDSACALLVVKPCTPLRALAQRAMSRSAALRFLPVVCTDECGRYLGVIRVEQLVRWLATR